MIYQFAFHDRVKPEPPECEMFSLYRKALKGEALTRKEKDDIAYSLYGTFGAHSSTYRLAGYAAPFSDVLPRFIVKIKHCGWHEYYAPDRTSLRKVLRGILEITE